MVTSIRPGGLHAGRTVSGPYVESMQAFMAGGVTVLRLYKIIW
jgi:hypothetical protein